MAEDSYKVEKILSTIVKDNQVFYKIKWVGYDEITEEPETNQDIAELAEEDWAKRVGGVTKKQKLSESEGQECQELSQSIKGKTKKIHKKLKQKKSTSTKYPQDDDSPQDFEIEGQQPFQQQEELEHENMDSEGNQCLVDDN